VSPRLLVSRRRYGDVLHDNVFRSLLRHVCHIVNEQRGRPSCRGGGV